MIKNMKKKKFLIEGGHRKMLLLDLPFFVLAPKRLGSFIRVHRVLTPKKTGPFIRTHRVLTRKIPGSLIRAHINVSFYRTPLKKTYTKVKERINPVARVTLDTTRQL
jgi:hypothetical protein